MRFARVATPIGDADARRARDAGLREVRFAGEAAARRRGRGARRPRARRGRRTAARVVRRASAPRSTSRSTSAAATRVPAPRVARARRGPVRDDPQLRRAGARLGAPRAARAVGAANGRNPLPIVLPCHRLVGADGSLTGFGGGLRRQARAARPRGRDRRTRGRGWQCSHAYVPRPAATNLTISPPHSGQPSPRRRWTRNSFWNAPLTPSAWRKSSIVAPPAARPARQRLADRDGERVVLRALERARRAQRMDPRAEQRLVGVDVPDARRRGAGRAGTP